MEKNHLFNCFLTINKSIHELYYIAKEENIDEFELVSKYMLFHECLMTEEEFEQNKLQISKIAEFFKNIINIDKAEL